MKLTYGDKIRIKGEKRTRKVLMEKGGYVYYGSYADKIKREDVEDLT